VHYAIKYEGKNQEKNGKKENKHPVEKTIPSVAVELIRSYKKVPAASSGDLL
jgi:hypothetical protein